MADLLGIGTSALTAYKRALDVTGHNISNSTTEGYSRQQVDLASQIAAGATIGSGVRTEGVSRLVDDLVTQRLMQGASDAGRLGAHGDVAARIDTLYSDADAGLGQDLDAFFNGLSQLASDPASTAVRTDLLGRAEALAAGFRRMGGELDRMAGENQTRLGTAVADVNRLAEELARVNDAIARGGPDRQPNDLLDTRDRLLNELSGLIDTRVVDQDDGSRNVFVAGGQPLVLGAEANRLTLTQDPFAGNGARLAFATAGQTVPIESQVSGGRIAGLLDARASIEAEQGRLGRLAASVALDVNAQHRAGVDSNGDRGGNFFAPPATEAIAHAGNTGSGSAQVALADPGALTGDAYELRYDGGWQLRNARTGAAIPTSGAGTAADPLRAEGLEIVVGGTPAAGDRFRLAPTQGAASSMQVAVQSPAGIAAAAAVGVESALANTGDAEPEIAVEDAGDPALTDPATVEFLSPTSYRVDGGPALAYDPAQGIAANGWRMSFTGTPVAGDTFTVSAVGPNSSNNGNALALADLGARGRLEGGSRSLLAESADMIAAAGGRARQSERQLEAVEAVQAQDRAEREAVSGVNLDEEAAALMRFEQAYQAAAKLVTVADDVFQTLLSAVRR